MWLFGSAVVEFMFKGFRVLSIVWKSVPNCERLKEEMSCSIVEILQGLPE